MKIDSKMVRQVTCQVSGCGVGGYNPLGVFMAGPYLTDADCQTVKERSEDLKDHIAMVHDRGRIFIEAEARRLEAEAVKISAETESIVAETARIAAVEKDTHGESHTKDQAGLQSDEGDWFHLVAAGADGWCSPMPTGLSPPEQHHGQVAGVQSHGVRHMRCGADGAWKVGPIESHGKVQLSLSLCEGAYESLDLP